MTHSPEELISRLRDTAKFLASQGHTNAIYCVRAVNELSRLLADNVRLRGERDEALREMTKYAREAGEATGRLETSEAAGIVDGWRERAQAAEARADRMEEALRLAMNRARIMKSAPKNQGPRDADTPYLHRLWGRWVCREGKELWDALKDGRAALSALRTDPELGEKGEASVADSAAARPSACAATGLHSQSEASVEMLAVLRELVRAGGIWPDIYPRVQAAIARAEGF